MKKGTKIIISALTLSMVGAGTVIGTRFLPNKAEALKAEANSKLAPETGNNYQGHPQYKGRYRGIDFLYSDGLFETDPKNYDDHMATASINLANASETVVESGNYSNGARTIESVYDQIGFNNHYVSYYYTHRPEMDSIGYIIGQKDIYLKRLNKEIKAISITIRSACYGEEWSSNVKLGTEGEAQGFREAAETVTNSVSTYIKQYKLQDQVDKGNLVFWVQGYSRGGATANLTAKRLVDKYQTQGNEVYAYCLEAPQGGVKKEEQVGRDYRGIHNVINVNDLVPYVAPSIYGFKRYGVDHYIWGTKNNDPDHLVKSEQFPNNVADNKALERPETSYYAAMIRELNKMIPNRKDRPGRHPYELMSYEVKIKGFDIEWVDNGETTSGFLKRFMNTLAGSTTRQEYYSRGLEGSLRRMMAYLNRDNEKDSFKDEFGKFDIATGVAAAIIPGLVEAGIMGYDMVKDYLYELITGKKDDQPYQMTSGVRGILANIVANKISGKEKIIKDFDNVYPGGHKDALSDIRTIIYYALGGVGGINDTITLAKNIDGILQNHTFLQTVAWLRAADNWYC